MHFLISILSGFILLQSMLSFIWTGPLGCAAQDKQAISWSKSLPDYSLPTKLWALCGFSKSTVYSFASSFFSLSLQSRPCAPGSTHFLFTFPPSVYWSCFLSTGRTSPSIFYKVHLQCHLLLEVFSSLQESMGFWTYSHPQSTLFVLLLGHWANASPWGSLILLFLNFHTRLGSSRTGTILTGHFFFLLPNSDFCMLEPSNKFTDSPSSEEFGALRCL